MSNIRLKNVRQNNLKGFDIDLPLGSFTVVCGPSGSGKSSLAFETLFAEGQRRYIESLNSYARQFLSKAPKPLVEEIENIPPAIALEQKNSVRNSRSTVGTSSDVIDFLRLLYSKVGTAHCPNGHGPIEKFSAAQVADHLVEGHHGERFYLLAPIYKDQMILPPSKLIKLLLGEGYKRLFVPKPRKKKTASSPLPGEFMDIDAKTKSSQWPKKDVYVVVDRFAVSKDDHARLTDSLQQAYGLSLQFNKQISGGHLQLLSTEGAMSPFTENLTCNDCHFHFPPMSSQLFSFNSPVGACETCNGFGNILTLDEQKIIPNPKLSLREGALYPYTMPSATTHRRELNSFCKKKNIDMEAPWDKLSKKHKQAIWEGAKGFRGVMGLFEHLETKKYKMHVRVFLSRFKGTAPCTDCEGGRLKPITKDVLTDGKSIQEISRSTLKEVFTWVDNLNLTDTQQESVKEVYAQLHSRLRFLVDIGVHYLSLDRPTRTLSGGEFQRLMLAKQLGMGLSDTLYVLDEPTIGLHPRDNDRLIEQLKQLNSYGNTLVIVEHDEAVIKNSQYIVELGPGSGSLGGEVVYKGTTDGFLEDPDSLTANFLKKKSQSLIAPKDVDMSVYKYQLKLSGCSGNNLKNVTLEVPLRRLVTITGVSGSGKSTLVTQTLYPALTQHLSSEEYKRGLPYKKLAGAQHLKNVLYINQESLGRTERSNPLTYLKVYDYIRDLFSSTELAIERGYTKGTFSLNVDGGRCQVCRGLGYEEVDMVFMDNLKMPCPACKGKKFRKEVLDVVYKGKNIHQVLNLTVHQAMDFFIHHPQIRKPLAFLKEVGLEYLKIGQSTSTFSGGEIQRIKIARELLSSKHKETLYILDEPTTGLHFREVQLLMDVLNKIIDMGGSVLLIEHNLDVMARSDYIIDIGPEAGTGGGKIMAQGSPLQLLKSKTHTGKALKEHLQL